MRETDGTLAEVEQLAWANVAALLPGVQFHRVIGPAGKGYAAIVERASMHLHSQGDARRATISAGLVMRRSLGGGGISFGCSGNLSPSSVMNLTTNWISAFGELFWDGRLISGFWDFNTNTTDAVIPGAQSISLYTLTQD